MADSKKQTAAHRTLPHNIDAEISLLGCILLDGEILADVCQVINADDFYAPQHVLIFESLTELLASGKQVDSIILTDSLIRNGNFDKVGGASYISTLVSGVPGSANFKEYLDIVYRTSMLRKLIKACSTVAENAYTADDASVALAEAEKLIFDLSAREDRSDLDRISGSVAEVLHRIDTLKSDKNAFKGTMTGFWALDNLTNGLHAGELIVLAARPAMGKSSLAMNIVENAAKKGKSCAVFSLEMPKTQIAQRLLCSCAGVPLSSAVKADLTEQQWRSLFETAVVLGKFNIFVDDSSLITPGQILSKCRKLKSRHGLDLLVIDYIQLMSSGKRNVENRQQEVSDISRSLKIMAKELEVPVIALSQLSRQIEMRQGKPQLSDLRESGAIEQDADIVMFIHKEKSDDQSGQKDDERELIVAKHRNGALDDIPLIWKGDLVRFESMSAVDVALRKQFKENQEAKKQREERNKKAQSGQKQDETSDMKIGDEVMDEAVKAQNKAQVQSEVQTQNDAQGGNQAENVKEENAVQAENATQNAVKGVNQTETEQKQTVRKDAEIPEELAFTDNPVTGILHGFSDDDVPPETQEPIFDDGLISPGAFDESQPDGRQQNEEKQNRQQNDTEKSEEKKEKRPDIDLEYPF